MGNAYIVGAVRTPGGKKDGKLKNWHPSDLGALVLDELVERTGAKGEMIDDVILVALVNLELKQETLQEMLF